METMSMQQFSSTYGLKILAFLRIAIGSFAIFQMCSFLPVLEDFLGPEGWIQWEITQAMNPLWKIHLADICRWFYVNGDKQVFIMYLFVGCYIISALSLTLGFCTQINAMVLTFLHAVFLKVVAPFLYGADVSLHFILFYLIFSPTNKCYAVDKKWHLFEFIPRVDPIFAIRILQVHLCMLYCSAGFEKLPNMDWWNGNALFYALTHPDFGDFELDWMVSFRLIPIALGGLTVLMECLYMVAMWIPYVRLFFLVGVCLMHVGIMLFLHLYLFGWIMIVLSLSAWGMYALYDVKKYRAQRKFKLKELPPKEHIALLKNMPAHS